MDQVLAGCLSNRLRPQSLPAGLERGLETAGSRRPPNAGGQDTAIRAPFDGERPTRHRPLVARTIESAMARPRPGARRLDRSLGGSDRRSAPARSSGMPGPLSSTVSLTRAPRRDGRPDRAALGRVLAGVVEKDAEQAVEPLGRRGDHDASPAWRATVEVEVARLGDDAEPVDRLRREHAEVDRLGVRLACGGVEAGEPQQVLEQPAHPLRLRGRSARRRAIPRRVSLLREGEARLGLDHRQRRAQLVRGVGGELELALARRSIGVATRRPMATAPRKTTRAGSARSGLRETIVAARPRRPPSSGRRRRGRRRQSRP